MNLSRTFAASLSSTNGKRSLLFRCLLLQSSSQSTRAASTETAAAATTTITKTASSETESKCPRQSKAQHQDPDAAPSLTVGPRNPRPVWPRPVEVPFQPKVANLVHLMGSVGMPVQLEVAPDGKYWAVSVLTQEKADDFPQLWIPIIFEGDLAQVAACHLKENDLIYVTGQLSGDPPPLNMQHGQTSTQVMVQGLSFAQKTEAPYEQNGYASNGSDDTSWKDLVENPNNWRDYRKRKVTPNYPDFKHKQTGEGLWLNSRTPSWALASLPPLEPDQGSKSASFFD